MDTAEFQKRMDALGLKQRDLAEAIDLGADKVSKIFSGVRQWKGFELSKAIEWLEGFEARALPQRPLDIQRAPEQFPTRSAYDDVGSVKLRSLDLELAMGDGTNIEEWIDEETIDFDAGWLRSITKSPSERLIVGRGVGDSMAPTIGDHDDVMINLDESTLNKLDRIWAITIEGAGAVKRLMPAGDNMIEVLSDNPAHPNRVRTYPREAIKIIGRVIWSGRRH